MGTHRAPRSSLLLLACVAASGAFFLAAGRSGPAASAGEVLRAGSVCEAQELKARKAEHPELQIEIAPEFDRPFPSLEACRSHQAAWDDSRPGPRQPIPFSHKHHAGEFGIDCLYCHSGTDRSRNAGVPAVAVCMGCHAQFPAEYDQLEGIRTLKQYWKEQRSIPWVQIHRLPEYVKFQHQAHVAAGFACQTCHGPVQELDKLYLVPDTRWWQYGLPTKKLEMGWCIMCHRDNNASEDCFTCHY